MEAVLVFREIRFTGSSGDMIWSVRGQFTQPGSQLITLRQGSIAPCGARRSAKKVALWVIGLKLDRVVKRVFTWGWAIVRGSGVALWF